MWTAWRRGQSEEVAKASQGTEFVAVLYLKRDVAEPSRDRTRSASASQGEDLPAAGNQAPPTDAWPRSLSLGARRLTRNIRGSRGMTSARGHRGTAFWRGGPI